MEGALARSCPFSLVVCDGSISLCRLSSIIIFTGVSPPPAHQEGSRQIGDGWGGVCVCTVLVSVTCVVPCELKKILIVNLLNTISQ